MRIPLRKGFGDAGVSRTVARPSVRLEPVSPPEYAQFIAEQIEEFANQKVRAGHWRLEDAPELSRHVVEGFLRPDGPVPGHRVWKALDESGRRVAWIWTGPPPVGKFAVPEKRWLYQITVERAVRRSGYGRAVLAATEAVLAREGVKELYLNVFRWNEVARRLYDSSGYVVIQETDTDAAMKKELHVDDSP